MVLKQIDQSCTRIDHVQLAIYNLTVLTATAPNCSSPRLLQCASLVQQQKTHSFVNFRLADELSKPLHEVLRPRGI